MSDAMLLGKGLLLGLAIAAPLGPIGALCINRTLERGFWAGMAGGLGTALADALYAALAALGFAAFTGIIDNVAIPLRLAGGLFMLWLGWQSFRPKPGPTAARIGATGHLGTVAATFALTMANPATILSFVAIFAGLGLADETEPSGKALVVLGVFVGSLLWWLVLSAGVALASRRLPAAFALWVSRVSGSVLIGFGLLAIASLWFRG